MGASVTPLRCRGDRTGCRGMPRSSPRRDGATQTQTEAIERLAARVGAGPRIATPLPCALHAAPSRIRTSGAPVLCRYFQVIPPFRPTPTALSSASPVPAAAASCVKKTCSFPVFSGAATILVRTVVRGAPEICERGISFRRRRDALSRRRPATKRRHDENQMRDTEGRKDTLRCFFAVFTARLPSPSLRRRRPCPVHRPRPVTRAMSARVLEPVEQRVDVANLITLD
jgi:hypothetical protein